MLYVGSTFECGYHTPDPVLGVNTHKIKTLNQPGNPMLHGYTLKTGTENSLIKQGLSNATSWSMESHA